MDMRKITCAILVAAATASAVVGIAVDESSSPAAAPAMHSGTAAVAPVAGLVGASLSLLSFLAFLQ